MPKRNVVTRREFNQIKDLLKTKNQIQVGKVSGRSQATVSVIDRTRSLGQYLEYHRKATNKSLAKRGVEVIPVQGVKAVKEAPKKVKSSETQVLSADIRTLAVALRDNTNLLTKFMTPVEEAEQCEDSCCSHLSGDEEIVDPLTRIAKLEQSSQYMRIAIWLLTFGLVFTTEWVMAIIVGWIQ